MMANKRKTGKTPRALRLAGSRPAKNPTEAKVPHRKPTRHTTALKMKLRQKLQMREERARGKMQYPMRETAWKKLIVPPSNIEFKTIKMAPNQGKEKAAAKMAELPTWLLVLLRKVQQLLSRRTTRFN